MGLPIICLDFDGVLHSFTSGHLHHKAIPDPPVNGAIKWLASMIKYPGFKIYIYSARSRKFGGRRAMKRWLVKQFKLAGEDHKLVKHLTFPLFKPPAFLMIDDRAMTFNGVFPSVEEIKDFKPWYKKERI